MKFQKMFLGMVAWTALSLTACSSVDTLENQYDDSNNVKAYMTLQLVGPKGHVNTRTIAGTGGTEEGTSVQNKIESAMILLCNQADHKILHTYTVKNFVATAEGVKTQPFTATAGTFDVYVVANPGSIVLTAGDDVTGKTIDDVTENLMKSAYAADNKFIMFNESNGTDKVGGSSITISATNDYNNPATCDAINLDRLAVQIRSNSSNLNIDDIKTENSFLTAAEMKGYKLLNGATKVNLQQHWSNTSDQQGTVAPWNNLLKTPELAEGTNAGNSGYYNHLTDFRTITKENEVYSVVKDLYATINPYNTEKGSIFCMENSPLSFKDGKALYGNTTGLVYQFQSTIEGSDEKAGKNCFYGYNGEYFATLSALQTAYPKAFDAAAGDNKLAAAEEELAAAYAQADKQTAISDFRVKYNVKVYTDGIMYYTYFIKDKNYKHEDAAYYSVMRNTIYDLTVTSLKRIGTDIPGGWTPDVDPEDPVDPVNVYMVVEAKVNDWVLSKEDIALD